MWLRSTSVQVVFTCPKEYTTFIESWLCASHHKRLTGVYIMKFIAWQGKKKIPCSLQQSGVGGDKPTVTHWCLKKEPSTLGCGGDLAAPREEATCGLGLRESRRLPGIGLEKDTCLLGWVMTQKQGNVRAHCLFGELQEVQNCWSVKGMRDSSEKLAWRGKKKKKKSWRAWCRILRNRDFVLQP